MSKALEIERLKQMVNMMFLQMAKMTMMPSPGTGIGTGTLAPRYRNAAMHEAPTLVSLLSYEECPGSD